MSAKQALEDVRTILQENPSLCLVGAMQERTRRQELRVGSTNLQARFLDTSNHLEAVYLLLNCMPPGSTICSWNEHPGRTHKERIALVKEAIDKT